MNLEGYRTVFIVTALLLMLVVASPGLSLANPFHLREQRFSELWVLGPTHMLWDYPFNVAIGEMKQIFVGVGNHMGHSSYYVVYIKFRNQTQMAPNSTTSMPSMLVPLYEFRAVVADGDTWETPVSFSFLEASRFGYLFNLTKVSINDMIFGVDYLSVWDSVDRGFYFQLFFELWMYDEAGSSFGYYNRFVGIWLNVTF